jgi:hypothetical protein
MAGVRSDLAVLGLEPGADRRAIDDAFRNLMKRHHPDRPGGDGARAAEIIRAYRALRPGAMIARDIEFRDRPGQSAAKWRWWVLGLLAAIAAVILASLVDPTPRSGPARLGTEVAEELGLQPPRELGLIEQPLNQAAIDSATDEVRAMIGRRDEIELAEKSRDCHLAFRASQDLVAFDRCVAFDLAVVLLQDRDPLRDQGPFRQISVNRRHWSDAAMLSSDSLAIDSRLDRIRLRVELRLAPAEPFTEAVEEGR